MRNASRWRTGSSRGGARRTSCARRGRRRRSARTASMPAESDHRALLGALRGGMEGHLGRHQRPRARARHPARALPLHMDHQRARHFPAGLLATTSPSRAGSASIGNHVRPEKYRGRGRLIHRELRFRLGHGACVRHLGRQTGRSRPRSPEPRISCPSRSRSCSISRTATCLRPSISSTRIR